MASEPQGHRGGSSVSEMTTIAARSLLRKLLFGTFKHVIVVWSVCLTRLCCLVCYISWNMTFEMSIMLKLEREKWIQAASHQPTLAAKWDKSGCVSMFMFSSSEVSFNHFVKTISSSLLFSSKSIIRLSCSPHDLLPLLPHWQAESVKLSASKWFCWRTPSKLCSLQVEMFTHLRLYLSYFHLRSGPASTRRVLPVHTMSAYQVDINILW